MFPPARFDSQDLGRSMLDEFFTKATRGELMAWRDWVDFSSDLLIGASLAMIVVLLIVQHRDKSDLPVPLYRRELASLFGWLASTRLIDAFAHTHFEIEIAAAGLRITASVVAMLTAMIVWKRHVIWRRGAKR